MSDIITPQQITFEQVPTATRWQLPQLFKTSETGSQLTWRVGFDGEYLEMNFGHVKGVIRTTRTKVTTNKSGRTLLEQALLEARQRYTLKTREGYHPANESANEQPDIRDCMLSHPYKESLITEWPVMTQPKLNGIRLLVYYSKGKVVLSSRNGLTYRHLTHLEEPVKQLLGLLPEGTMLDGELYQHKMNFVDLTSAVRTVNKVHPRLIDVQYWLFDLSIPGLPFEQRYQLLSTAMAKIRSTHLQLVPCQQATSHQQIAEFHKNHILDGYEGLMVRKTSGNTQPTDKRYQQSLYRLGRCNNILKMKDFVDEEALVIEVLEAKGTEEGTALLRVRDIRDNLIIVRMRGSFDDRRHWLLNPTDILGKKITLRYQELSVYGVPIFPVGIAVRDYE